MLTVVDLNEWMWITITVSITGLLVLAGVYRFLSQRRQLSSGRIIGRFYPQQQDGKFIFNDSIIISTGGIWCRMLLTLKSREVNKINFSPRNFFEKVTVFVGSPYMLTLKDSRNRVVHTEERSLEPFMAWLGSHRNSIESMSGEYSTGGHQGTVTILEFKPEDAGRYSLSLQITDKLEAESQRSSSMWEILEVELTVVEDVIPLSRTVNYPHQRVNIK